MSAVFRSSLILRFLCLFVAIKSPVRNGVVDFDCHKKAQKAQRGE
jgi:hypothetical protein